MSDPALTWNPALGLCRQEAPGHTAPVADLPAVHNGVVTATHLCVLAQKGLLDEAQALAALRSFRAMQQGPGTERAGCLRWYWEESQPVDTNASFFIGLCLQLLYLAEGTKLTEPVRAAIREIVEGLAVWFEHELIAAHPRYPNKCMGDLVCGWLAAGVLGRSPSEKLQQTTREWCDYWAESHWGWGEHMSDIYTMVLLTELSAVLLFCPDLPPDIRARFKRHFDELLRIEDSYRRGPRVPVIRSYAFTESPPVMPFRGFICDAFTESDSGGGRHPAIAVRIQAAVFGVWFQRAGWNVLAPAEEVLPEWVETSCREGAVARALVRNNLRIGAMSHYPIMAGVDHPTWGLSWQTFPAALWRPQGDWAFWRWTTREGDRVRAHPALDKHSAYLGNALSAQVDPPPLPRMTSTLSPAGHLVMERELPLPGAVRWDEVEDAFCLLESDAVVRAEKNALELRWPDAVVRVRWLGDAPISWEPAARGGRWVVRYSAEQLTGRAELTHRWELQVGYC
ncbi:MAG: hypothetical protein H7A44_06270 [Opitutaceae bacterium]|nr:hypothetical protein [Cephaloticoccus sp.]MCP5530028.1 hypothetical protein [Opitutaceae bacterium]